MYSGIISNNKEEEIADFLINSGYDDLDIIPVVCIQTGSRAYGVSSENSDRDYIAMHIMDTWQCLEHPKFRDNLQVIRLSYDEEYNKVIPGPEAAISLDSFELWQVVDMWIKGAFSICELLHLPTIHQEPTAEMLFHVMKQGITTKVGHAAIGTYRNDWKKRPTERKKTVLTFYRIIQAIYLLKEGEFQWDAKQLWSYMEGEIPAAKATLELYMQPGSRTDKLTKEEIFFVEREFEFLLRELKNAIVSSRLPDKIPNKVLRETLRIIKETRGKLI